MGKNTATLRVYFEDPFWVGVYERTQDGRLQVCRVVFGAEPGNAEIDRYFLGNYRALCFSPPVDTGAQEHKISNPKRMQRAVSRQITRTGGDTRAREALRLQREQNKREGRKNRRQRSEEEKARLFKLHREKKKRKHTGR